MTLAVALAALLAVDGGVDVVDVERATIVQARDAGIIEVDGGVWLSDGYTLGFARELASKRVQVQVLKASPPVLPLEYAITVAVTLVLGAVGGAWFECRFVTVGRWCR